jgi:hypothetical protein
MLVKEQPSKICSHCLRLCRCQMPGSHSRYAPKSISLPSPAWYWSGRTKLYHFLAYWQMERWVMAVLVCFVAILDLSQMTSSQVSPTACARLASMRCSQVLITSWIVIAIVLSLAFYFAAWNLHTIPTSGQNFVEYIYINLLDT